MPGSMNCRVALHQRGPRLHVFFAVALVISLTGCYRRDALPPSSWPAISAAVDIESLVAGSYSCSGEIVNTHTGFREKRSIVDFLIGGENPPVCEHIELLRPAPDEITIRFMAGGKEITSTNYTRQREYYVEQNWIFLKAFEEFGKEFIVRKHEVQTPRLTVDRENNLIIKQTISFSGTMMIVVPFGMAGTEWGRFKRLP